MAGVIIAPVVLQGAPVIPAGTRVTGTTADASAAQAAANDNEEKPATLRLQFTKIIDRQGREEQLSATVESVQQPRRRGHLGLITTICLRKPMKPESIRG